MGKTQYETDFYDYLTVVGIGRGGESQMPGRSGLPRAQEVLQALEEGPAEAGHFRYPDA